MEHAEHLKRSHGRWPQVHEFLDRYYAKFGPDHRVVLHHMHGVMMVAMAFGSDAAVVAIHHILDDTQGKLPYGPDDRSAYRAEWAEDPALYAAAYDEAQKLLRDYYAGGKDDETDNDQGEDLQAGRAPERTEDTH